MSYKDLEREISQRMAAKRAADQKIADKKQYKQQRTAINKAKAARAPMFRPDPPPNYRKVVVMNVRRLADGMHGDLLTVQYTVDTVAAETAARTLAEADGYVWRGTVDIQGA